jgi:LacI family transcriptional regulator
MAVTLYEVAKKVGVSPATVSIAIRGKRAGKFKLAAKTVKNVRRIAKSMGYRPNMLASSLRNNRTHMIGVVVAALQGDFYGGILNGINQVIRGTSVTPVLAAHNYNSADERKDLEGFIGKRMDGIIAAYAGCPENADLYLYIMDQLGVPLVLIDREIPGLELPIVRSDHYMQTYKAIMALRDLGHKRILYITGAPVLESTELRKQGYIAAMREENLEEHIKIVAEHPVLDLRIFAKKALDVWQKSSPTATALLIQNDLIAYEILAECNTRGIKVPDDLSVMGLDNCFPSSLDGIGLSTVTQKPDMIGQKACELLLKLTNGQSWDKEPTILPVEVIMRKTTKAI